MYILKIILCSHMDRSKIRNNPHAIIRNEQKILRNSIFFTMQCLYYDEKMTSGPWRENPGPGEF